MRCRLQACSSEAARAIMKTNALRLGLVLGLLALNSTNLRANVVITSPTGGNNVSTDKALNSTNGAAFAALGNLVITEGAAADFGAGANQTLILTAPSGWQFNAGTGAVSFTTKGDITAATIAVTPSTATITMSVSGTGKMDALTISGLQVQALEGANVPGAGYIRRLFTNPGTAAIAGIELDYTTFGLLNQVAGTGRALAIETQPGANTTAGVPFSPQPAIGVVDQFGNVLTLDNTRVVTAARAGGTGTLQGSLTAKCINGVATYTNLSMNVAGTITVLFTATNLTSVTSAPVVVGPAPADRLAFATQPGSASAGVPFGIQPVIKTQDRFGSDSVVGLPATLPVTVSLSTGSGTLSGTTTLDIGTAAGNGVVSFSNLQIDVAGSNKQLTASGAGLSNGVSAPFGVSAAFFSKLQLLVPGETAAPGTPAGKTGTPNPQAAGTPFNITVNAVDANWNIVDTIVDTIRVTSTDPKAILPANAALASGTKTLGVTLNTIGSATLTATDVTDGSKSSSSSPAITVGGGTPAKLAIQTQPSSAATAGLGFAQQPVIAVQDAGGNLVVTDNGRLITVSRGLGTGPLQGTLTATTANGLAAFTNLSYNVAEAISLSFSASGLSGTASSNIVVGPNTAQTLAFTTQPGGASRVGSALANQPVVQAQDQFGNTSSMGLPDSLSVSLTLTSGSGSLLGTTTVDIGAAAGNGTAIFADLQCSDAGTNKQLTASATGFAIVASAAFNVGGTVAATGGEAISADTVSGTFTTLSGPVYYEVASADVKTGTIILNAPAGFIFDTGGTAPTVLITRIGGSGGTANNINGVVSGTAAAITSRTTSQITFTASSTSAAGVTCALTWQNIRVRPGAGTPLASGNITKTGSSVMQAVVDGSTAFGSLSETAGIASRLAFVTQPAGATAGAPFGIQPGLRTRDQFGNDSVIGLPATLMVNMALSSGSGTLLGTTSVDIGTAAGNGIATYADLRIDVTQTTKQLTASASGFTSAVSSYFTVMPAAASKLVVQTQPSATATAGVVFAQQPVIWITDQFGNLRNFDSGAAITAVQSAGSGTLQGSTTAIAVNGVASFTNLSHVVATSLAIDFACGALTGATSAAVVVNPAAASQLTIQTQPSSTATAGTPFAQQPVIRIEDQFGNLRSSDNSTLVTATRSAGSGTLQGTTSRTAVNGVVSFTDLSHPVVTNITILFTSGSLASETSTLIAVGPAMADRLVFMTQPGGATAGSAFGVQPLIKTRDPFGNDSIVGLPATLVVTLSLNSGTGPLQGTATADIGTAAGNGTISFADLRIDAAGTNKQLTASASGLAAGLSSMFTVNSGTATRLTIQRQPSSTATAGTAFAIQPVIQIEDAFGNRVTTDSSTAVTATRNAGTAALQGTTIVTAAGGLASFSNLSYNKAETITIDFSGGTLAGATSANVAVGAGAASKLVIQTQPSSSAVAGVPFAQQPVIVIQDAYGNLRTTDNSTVVTAARNLGSGTLQGTLSATANNGVAGFANLAHNVATTINLNFSSTGLTSATSASIVVSPGEFSKLQLLVPGETAAPGTSSGKTGTPNAQVVGTAFAVTVNAVDDYWNLDNTATDTLNLSSSDSTADLPADSVLVTGTASLPVVLNTSGNFTITATGLSNSTRGAGTSSPITVNPAQYTAATGGGTISADTTGGTWTSLTGPTYTENTSADVGVGTLILNAPNGFVFDTGGTAPTVLITRVGGSGSSANNINDVTSGTAASMTSVTSTQLLFTVTSSSASGITCKLTWQNVRVRPAAGTPLASGPLRESGTAAVAGVSTNSNLGFLREVAGAASRLGIQTQPSAIAVAGAPFAQQPIIQIRDQFGNVRSAANGTSDNSTLVTAARNAGSGTLQGTLTATAIDGVASFTNLYHTLATNITLAFTASGLTGTNSSPIAVGPATADRLVFATQPGSSIYGSPLSPQPVIKSRDPFGNDSTIGVAPSQPVTLAVSTGSGSLGGATTLDIGTAAGNGTTAFAGLSVNAAGTGKQLSASAPGLTSAVSTAFSVTKATVTGSITANNKIYDGTTAAMIATRSLNGVLPGDDVSLTGGTAAFASKTAGTAKTVTATGLSLAGVDAGNYQLSSTSATALADITPRPLLVSATGLNKVYNGTTAATVTLADNRVAGDTLTTSYTSASFADKNVGAAKPVSVSGISLSGTDAPNYTANTTATTTADITARALSVSATGINKVYDGTTGATATLSDNRLAGDSLSASYAGASFADKNVGTAKAVSVSGISVTGADSGNYTFNTSASTTANITARALTVTATAPNKVYDGTTTATAALSDNRLTGDSFTVSYTSARFADKNVGTGKPVTVSGISLSGSDAANYLPNTSATAAASITPRALTVSATGNNKVYDGTPSASVSLADNRLAGDVLNATYTAATFADKNVGQAKAVSVSGISVGGTDAGNYTWNTNAGTTANITPATVTAVVSASNKVYDGTTAATIATRSLSGVVAGDDLALSGGTAAFADKRAGTGKSVTVTGLSLTGSDTGNYQLASTSAGTTADITPRALLISATAVDRVYDGTTNASVTLSDNRVAGDTLSTSYTNVSFADKNVGTAKPVTVSGISLSGIDAPNYIANTAALASADITPRALAISAAGTDKVYDGTTAATVSLSDDRIPGDSLSTSYTNARFADKNAGTSKPISISGISVSGTDAANYSFNSTATASADIAPKALSVSGMTAADKVYDANTSASIQATGATLVGVLSGDTVSLNASAATGAFADKTAGMGKPVNISGLALSGADAGNYSLNQPTAIASITKAGLTVTADNKTRAAGQPNPTLTATYTGFAGGESLATSGVTGLPALSATATNTVGTYPIIAGPGSLSALNYSFSFQNGLLTVTPGTASKLVIITEPSSSAVAGVPFARQPAIGVQDAYGNLRTADNSTVVTAARNLGSGTLQGTLSATANNGVAGFANLAHNVATTINLNFSSTGLTSATSASIVVSPGEFSKLQLLVPGETAAPGTSSGKTGAPNAQVVDAGFGVTVNAVDDYWNPVSTATDIVELSSSDAAATLPPDTALVGGTANLPVVFNANGNFTLTATDLTDGTKTAGTSPSIAVNPAQYVPASGGEAISADTVGGAWTSLTGPTYTENASGDVGVGTVILNTPNGFVFDTGGTAPTVLITRVAGSGSSANNINDVSSGTAVSMTSVTSTQLVFTVTSSSANGMACRLTWQNVRVRPAAGTPLASGSLRGSGTAAVVGLSSTSSLGFLREVAGAARNLAVQAQPSATAIAGVAFARQPVLQVRDQFGNIRNAANGTSDNSTVVTAARSAGSGTLQGTLTATAIDGVAGFSNLFHTVATNITLAFSASGVTSTNSAVIAISPAAADRLVFATQPGNGTVGAPLAIQPILRSRDAFGNDSTVGVGGSKSVALALTSGTGPLLGTITLDIGTGVGNGAVAFVDVGVGSAGTNKQLTASAQGLSSAVSSPFTVNKNTQTIAFDALANKTYGDAAFPVSATASSGLPVTFSIVSGPATITGSLVRITGVGTVTVRAAQAGDDSWAAATPVDRSFSVAKATLTISAENKSRTYGATNPPLTATYSGFVNGEDSSVLSGRPTLSTSATIGSPVAGSPYPITVTQGTLSAANYQFSFVAGTMTLMKATLTVTAADKVRLYGAPNPSLTASYSGFVNGENATVLSGSPSLSTTATATSSVAGNPYPIAVQAGSLNAANYAFIFVSGNLIIQPAPLAVTADDASRAYGQTNPVFSGTLTGLQNAENIVATYSTPAAVASPVGNYPIIPSLVDPDGHLANYTVASTNGTLTIAAAQLVGTVADKSRPYGQANPAFTVQYSGFLNGDDESILSGQFVGTTTATLGSPVGNYPITGSGQTAINYVVTYVAGTLRITPCSLGVIAELVSRPYGAVNPVLTGTLSGVQNGDNITVSYSTIATAASAVGNYAIVPSLSDPDGKLGNYTVSLVPGTLTITPAVLTATAANAARPYGQPNPAFSGTLTGVQNNDHITVSFTTSATASSPAGTYPIVPGLADPDGKLGNYTVNATNGTLTISKVMLTVAADNQTRVYGAPDPIFTFSYSGFVAGENASVLSGSPALSTTATAGSSVAGSPYPITPSRGSLAAANYDFAFAPGELTITPAFSQTAVTSSANPSPTGSNVFFTASLIGVAPSLGVPTGNVQFSADGSPLGVPVTLVSGVANLNIATLSHGVHTITAQYPGDGNFIGSTNNIGVSQVIDWVPVATLATYTRASNAWIQIAIPDFLTKHVSDADGDPISLLSVSSGRNGATVLLFGGSIYYLPSNTDPNRNTTDYLDYAVSDDFPGGTVTNQIVIQLEGSAPAAPAMLTGITASQGGVTISFTGSASTAYRIERTAGLEPGAFDWQQVGSVSTDATGRGEFTDVTPPGDRAFYRAVWP